jgi:hypothetical protein
MAHLHPTPRVTCGYSSARLARDTPAEARRASVGVQVTRFPSIASSNARAPSMIFAIARSAITSASVLITGEDRTPSAPRGGARASCRGCRPRLYPAPLSLEAQRSHVATVEDLRAIPEEKRFHEIIDGEFVRKAMPTPKHGGAQLRSGELMRPYNRRPAAALRAGGGSPARSRSSSRNHRSIAQTARDGGASGWPSCPTRARSRSGRIGSARSCPPATTTSATISSAKSVSIVVTKCLIAGSSTHPAKPSLCIARQPRAISKSSSPIATSASGHSPSRKSSYPWVFSSTRMNPQTDPRARHLPPCEHLRNLDEHPLADSCRFASAFYDILELSLDVRPENCRRQHLPLLRTTPLRSYMPAPGSAAGRRPSRPTRHDDGCPRKRVWSHPSP